MAPGVYLKTRADALPRVDGPLSGLDAVSQLPRSVEHGAGVREELTEPVQVVRGERGLAAVAHEESGCGFHVLVRRLTEWEGGDGCDRAEGRHGPSIAGNAGSPLAEPHGTGWSASLCS